MEKGGHSIVKCSVEPRTYWIDQWGKVATRPKGNIKLLYKADHYFSEGNTGQWYFHDGQNKWPVEVPDQFRLTSYRDGLHYSYKKQFFFFRSFGSGSLEKAQEKGYWSCYWFDPEERTFTEERIPLKPCFKTTGSNQAIFPSQYGFILCDFIDNSIHLLGESQAHLLFKNTQKYQIPYTKKLSIENKIMGTSVSPEGKHIAFANRRVKWLNRSLKTPRSEITQNFYVLDLRKFTKNSQGEINEYIRSNR